MLLVALAYERPQLFRATQALPQLDAREITVRYIARRVAEQNPQD